MTPRFIMHKDYEAREVEFVLSRERNGWKFYGRDHQGYLIPAHNSQNVALCNGERFATKREAATMASILDLPAYAIWNGRTRSYDGQGAKFRAYARNHEESAQ